jgi:hypothetical protein
MTLALLGHMEQRGVKIESFKELSPTYICTLSMRLSSAAEVMPAGCGLGSV